MSDDVYKALAQASSGFVESPAGCGKTEAIVRTVGSYCDGRQLILTHTHSGVDALRQRFRHHSVPASMYHIDTIAGWSWNWVRRYPDNAQYAGSTAIAQWSDVYVAMSILLQKDFVKRGIINSYTGIIVDEYQDCTVPMHQLIVQLKTLLPCRVLGDDLQGVFGFREDPLISWSVVTDEFRNNLGALQTPHRWIKADNEVLGYWLLSNRSRIREEREPDYDCSPIDRQIIRYADLAPQLVRLIHQKRGRVCVIGPKARSLPTGIETILVKNNFRVLEPNDLSELRSLILSLSDGSRTEKSDSALDFLIRAHGGLSGDDRIFIERIIRGKNQRPRRTDRRLLCEKHSGGTTPQLVYDLIKYIEQIAGTSRKLSESISAFKCIMEEHIETGIDLKTLYAREIGKRKYQNRRDLFRCIGSTLLVKGLEFDHTIILRGPFWQRNWGNFKDLYVALTRGSKTITMMELIN